MLSLTCFQTAADNENVAAVREANGAAKEAVQESGNMSSGYNVVAANDNVRRVIGCNNIYAVPQPAYRVWNVASM